MQVTKTIYKMIAGHHKDPQNITSWCAWQVS
jgi:hypothetical protein